MSEIGLKKKRLQKFLVCMCDGGRVQDGGKVKRFLNVKVPYG